MLAACRWLCGCIFALLLPQNSHAAIVQAPPITYDFNLQVTTMSGASVRGQLVLVMAETAPECRGYVILRLPDGFRSLELVSGRMDGQSGKMRLHVHEVRSTRIGLMPCDYSGVFDQKTCGIVDGKKWQQESPDLWIAWTAEGKVAAACEIEADAKDWLAPQTDMQRLLRELTDSYGIGKTIVNHGPGREELELLGSSPEPHVREFADEALSILKVQQETARTLDFRQEAAKFWVDVVRFEIQEFIEDSRVRQEQRENGEEETGTGIFDTFFAAAKFIGRPSGALNSMAEKLVKAIEAGPGTQARQNKLRDDIGAVLREPPREPLPASRVSARIGVGEGRPGRLGLTSPGFILLKNNGDQPLHHATINVDVVVDRDAMENAWEQELPDWFGSGLVQRAIGVSKELIGNTLKLRELQVQTLRAGFGSLVHVQTWPARAEIEIELNSLQQLGYYTKAVRAWVVADEGIIELPAIPAASLRKIVENKLKAEQKRPAPTKTPARTAHPEGQRNKK